MKSVTLAYGQTGLPLDVPDTAEILTSRQAPGLIDEAAAILAALRSPINAAPLREKVKSGDTVAIVHTDITRATPNALIIPILIQELEVCRDQARGYHADQRPGYPSFPNRC